jgi:lipopolysaccharide assembly protein A
MQRSLIFALLLILIVVVFALQNSDPVQIKLLFWNVESSIAFVMTSVLFIGALLGVLFSLPSIFKKREQIAELKEKLEEKPKQ